MQTGTGIDKETKMLIDYLLKKRGKEASPEVVSEVKDLLDDAENGGETDNIIIIFSRLSEITNNDFDIRSLGITKEKLVRLAILHEEIDDYNTSVAARLHARKNVRQAVSRIKSYLNNKEKVPSGIEISSLIEQNQKRFREFFKCSEKEWNTFSWQMSNRITDAKILGKLIDLTEKRVKEILRVQKKYRMSITPYYASLIVPGKLDDPVLIQCVPDIKEVENTGEKVTAFSQSHSPARLIDQIYPQTAIIKVTNICAMYCRHCLRPHDIGFKDKHWDNEGFQEALKYVEENKNIRDILLTGGDALSLSNDKLEWILNRLVGIDHVKVIRIGTRMVVTVPQRIDEQLLNILNKYCEKKPIRMPVQINSAQEITKYSKSVLQKITKAGIRIMSQSVFLKGVNDTKLKMWKLLETLQEARVQPYYLFNCSYRDPQFKHLRVPVGTGREIIRSTIGNLSGDIRPTYIATAGGKIPLNEDYLTGKKDKKTLLLKKPWNNEIVEYPDA